MRTEDQRACTRYSEGQICKVRVLEERKSTRWYHVVESYSRDTRLADDVASLTNGWIRHIVNEAYLF